MQFGSNLMPSLPTSAYNSLTQELPGLTLHRSNDPGKFESLSIIYNSILRCYVIQDKIQTTCNSSSDACFLCKGHEVQA